MALDATDMIDSVRNEIGLDAYHIYPSSKRSIPDAVLWGFASACLLEFVKGLVDFKSFGEAVRSKLDGLLQHWRDKEDFEDYLKSEGIERAVLSAVEAIPKTISMTQRATALKNLEDALVEIGLSRDAAGKHATRIDEIIATSA